VKAERKAAGENEVFPRRIAEAHPIFPPCYLRWTNATTKRKAVLFQIQIIDYQQTKL